MQTGLHSLMQNSANEDPFFVWPVYYDVSFVLETAIALSYAIAAPANFKIFHEAMEASFHAVEIAQRLRFSPRVHCVVGNV
jgi:hypothetical protein